MKACTAWHRSPRQWPSFVPPKDRSTGSVYGTGGRVSGRWVIIVSVMTIPILEGALAAMVLDTAGLELAQEQAEPRTGTEVSKALR